MNWKLVFSLATAGVVMGFASVFGYTRKVEWVLWLIIAVISAYWIAKNVSGKRLLYGLLVGLCDGVVNSLIQASLFALYLTNNQEAAESLGRMPGGLEPRLFVLAVGPAIGIVYGLFIGLFTLAAARFIKRPQESKPFR